MRSSWRETLKRLATGCAVFGAATWYSAMCYAQIAADYATDPVYANGWQGTTTNNTTGVQMTTGDNGGFGFEPWNFDTDWLFNPDPIDGIQAIDDGLKTGGGNANSSPFNDIGKAWRMALPPSQTLPNPDPPPATVVVNGLPRAGRGFAPLQVGQTMRVVFDSPAAPRSFFKGYFIRFNSRNGDTTGGGNICYDFPGYTTACTAANLNNDDNYVPLGATPEPKVTLSRFEYFDMGQWYVADAIDENPATPTTIDAHPIPLFDTNTATGAQLDLTITGPDTYSLTIDPFGPAASHTQTGTLLTPGEPIDWIEFTFFHRISELANPTDLYIRSLEIFAPPTGLPGDFNEDDKVDAADYVYWRKAAAAGLADLPNDSDAAGLVGETEYNLWRENFGEMAGAGGGQGNGVVPEPGTFVLMIVGATGLICYGLNHRRTRE